VGESESARTERDLRTLRARIDTDLGLILERVIEDLDVREIARRRPVPVLGGAAAAGTLIVAAIARRVAEARRGRPASEIDELIERLGGRIDKLKGRKRQRLRESIRKEIGDVEMGRKIERSAWLAVTAGLTALATALAQNAARRFIREAPESTPARVEPWSSPALSAGVPGRGENGPLDV
jgi:hypothetical protein